MIEYSEMTHDIVAAGVLSNADNRRGNATLRIDCDSGFCTEQNDTTVSTSQARRGICSIVPPVATRTV